MSTAFETITPPTPAPPGHWTVDPRHSNVEFEVEHLAITTVKGRFRDFAGTLDVDEAGGLRAHGSVWVDSLDTGALERDAHLLSRDFLDVERYPLIRYALLAFRTDRGGRIRALGELTIRGVTRQTALDARMDGPVRDRWSNHRISLQLEGAFNRREFGLRWDSVLDGNHIVGDEVRVALGLSLVQRAVDVPPLDRRLGPRDRPRAA